MVKRESGENGGRKGGEADGNESESVVVEDGKGSKSCLGRAILSSLIYFSFFFPLWFLRASARR